MAYIAEAAHHQGLPIVVSNVNQVCRGLVLRSARVSAPILGIGSPPPSSGLLRYPEPRGGRRRRIPNLSRVFINSFSRLCLDGGAMHNEQLCIEVMFSACRFKPRS
jgi:hypothetical protein